MKLAHVVIVGLLSSLVSVSAHAQTGAAEPIANPTDPDTGLGTSAADKPSAENGDSINNTDQFAEPKQVPAATDKDASPGKVDASEASPSADAAAPAAAPVEAKANEPVTKPIPAVKAPKNVSKPNSATNTKPAVQPATAIKDPSAADLNDDLNGNPNTSTSATRARSRIRSPDVGLTPEQTNAIIEIRKTGQSELEKRLTEELRVAKTEMNASMMDASSADDVRRKFEIVQKKYLELQRIKFDRTLRIREVLSIDQRKKLQGLKNSH